MRFSATVSSIISRLCCCSTLPAADHCINMIRLQHLTDNCCFLHRVIDASPVPARPLTARHGNQNLSNSAASLCTAVQGRKRRVESSLVKQAVQHCQQKWRLPIPLFGTVIQWILVRWQYEATNSAQSASAAVSSNSSFLKLQGHMIVQPVQRQFTSYQRAIDVPFFLRRQWR